MHTNMNGWRRILIAATCAALLTLPACAPTEFLERFC